MANLLTPAVRNWILRVIYYGIQVLRFSGRKIAKIRLKQLQEERDIIEAYHANPINLAKDISYYTVLQLVILWITIAALIYVIWFSAIGQTLIHSAWSGAIFGLIGYATRFPIGALVMLSNLNKVADIDNFRAKNQAAQEEVITLLDH